MRRFASILIFLLAFAADLRATDVLVTLPPPYATNRTVLVQNLTAPNAFQGSVQSGEIIPYYTTNLGYFIITNAAPGFYTFRVTSPPGTPYSFGVLVTATNLGQIRAENYLAVSGLATFPPGSVAWAASTTDARYGTNGGGAAVAADSGINVNTNGNAVSIGLGTNITFQGANTNNGALTVNGTISAVNLLLSGIINGVSATFSSLHSSTILNNSTFSSDGLLFTSDGNGNVTASSFAGNGASLTGLGAAHLTPGGTLPALNAFALTNLSTPYGATIWVDAVNGNDSTGVRGDATHPFLTIGYAAPYLYNTLGLVNAGAIGVAQAGDVIHLRPGKYTNMYAVLPPNVSLIGDSPYNTILYQSAGGGSQPLLSVGPALTPGSNSVIANLSIICQVTNSYAAPFGIADNPSLYATTGHPSTNLTVAPYQNVTVLNCFLSGCTDGNYVSSTNTQNARFYHCRFVSNWDTDALISTNSVDEFYSCTFLPSYTAASGSPGLAHGSATQAGTNRFFDCHFYSAAGTNANECIHLYSGAAYVWAVGCSFGTVPTNCAAITVDAGSLQVTSSRFNSTNLINITTNAAATNLEYTVTLGGTNYFYGQMIGNASGLTNANATTLFGSGTVPTARLPVGSGSQQGVLQADGTTITASGGTISVGAIPASDITSGTIATARLGSGTADGSHFLAGDQTYKTIAGGSGTVTSVSGPSIITWATSTTTPTGTLNNQTSNTFLAGPLNGAAAAPTFRGLDVTDFGPLLSATHSNVTASRFISYTNGTAPTITTNVAGIPSGTKIFWTNIAPSDQRAVFAVVGNNGSCTNFFNITWGLTHINPLVVTVNPYNDAARNLMTLSGFCLSTVTNTTTGCAGGWGGASTFATGVTYLFSISSAPE